MIRRAHVRAWRELVELAQALHRAVELVLRTGQVRVVGVVREPVRVDLVAEVHDVGRAEGPHAVPDELVCAAVNIRRVKIRHNQRAFARHYTPGKDFPPYTM